MDFWAFIVAAFVAGALVAYLISLQVFRKSATQTELKKLQEEHGNLQTELHNYRQSVRDHFVETASLLDDVNESHKRLYKTMATGVTVLCAPDGGDSPEALTQKIQALTTQDSDASKEAVDEDAAPEDEAK